MLNRENKINLPTAEQALTGRSEVIEINALHFVNGNKMSAPYPDGLQQAMFGMGCFWGAEKKFWSCEGVYITAVGYAAGYTENPTYQEVCSGKTAHNEVVYIIFDPLVITYGKLLTIFWNSHNPTQGMCQGNDIGTQYRSGIYFYSIEQQTIAQQSCTLYQDKISEKGFASITTEIKDASILYFAEDYHQQYLAKNPNGYCGLGGIGVQFDFED